MAFYISMFSRKVCSCMDGNGREVWGSQLGFIMAAAGSAVGLGNVWRFPYLVGMNGGAAFVFVYIALAITVGSTVMLAEFCLGRASRKNSVGTFRTLSSHPFWGAFGWIGLLVGGFIILSYYGVIAGWTIKYMIHSLTGLMEIAGEGGSGDALGTFLGNRVSVVAYQCVAMAITIAIVAGGIGKGIERSCKVLMPLLFMLLLILIARAVTLPGASEGISFYLKPDFSKLTGKSILDALGQGFFSLSLGMGIMITYGSYISKDENLPRCALMILGMDTAIAFLAGFAIFPAVFAMGVEPGAGVGLTFVTLPGVFAKMPMGGFFSCLFFMLLFFAALTSMMSLLEVAVSFIVDEFNVSRKMAAIGGGIFITLLGIPSALSLSGSPKLFGMDFFDFMDYISNNILMPTCAIGISLFVGWVWADSARKEVTNDGMLSFGAMGIWMISLRFIAPIAIALILLSASGILKLG